MGFLFGGSGGGGGDSNPALNTQARLAEQLFQSTNPLRQSLLGEFANPFDPRDFTSSPSTDALQTIINQQFSKARDATIATTPRGGGLSGALAGLEGDRAAALASGMGQLFGQDKSRAAQQRFSAAFGTPGTALSSLGSAGAAQAGLAGQQAAADANKGGSIGQAAGFAAGSKLGAS